MRALISRKVSLAWLVAAFALAPALGILYKLWVLDAPPSGVVITAPLQTPTGAVQAITRGQVTPPAQPLATFSPTSDMPIATPGIATAPATKADATTQSAATPSTAVAELIVYISGEVAHPGVYHMPLESRIADLVSAAGGTTAQANGDLINLAERLQDEEHVIVPAKSTTPVLALVQTPLRVRTPTPKAAKQTATTVKPSAVPAGKVNINTATEQELETLPGIGPSLAARIIEYRQANGPFAAPEDLMNVPGIKEGVFSKVRDSITVGP